MKQILLLEDDENLNRGISLKLSREGYRVFSALTLTEARALFDKENIDLVICDITLPDGNGLDFGKAVREKSNSVLIYLTAMDQEIDIVNGYDTGADDYITKSFSVNILTSKVNAFMRRLSNKEEGIYTSGDIEVSVNEMQVKKAGAVISLSKTELQLEGLFYTAGTLLVAVGGGSAAGYPVFLWAKSHGVFSIRNYHYPLAATVVMILMLVLVQVIMVVLIEKSVRKDSLIDRIRFEN